MKIADYLVDVLNSYGVTDAFGIPGGVILDFLYSLNSGRSTVQPHLNYHEQMAGFAACGYAQASGKLGVAYATRGPGICNMVTCIAEAYQESLPVLFITAHGNKSTHGTRFDDNQELDIVNVVRSITKYSAVIDKLEDLKHIKTACDIAIKGRKGPIVLDFAAPLWNKEIADEIINDFADQTKGYVCFDEIIGDIKKQLKISKRPIILIGDGLRHSTDIDRLRAVAEKINIPILSSRGAQDLLCGINNYFGYIGSHGIRYSNFILSKADYIISIGNRLAFQTESKSFNHFVKDICWTRVDIDKDEFSRKMDKAHSFELNAGRFIDYLYENNITIPGSYQGWLKTCSEIKTQLFTADCIDVVDELTEIISVNPIDVVYVTDAGNNEFWFSRAFEKVQKKGTILASKSFGTTGSALGKAIGAYYAFKKPITCVIGDQGFQFNLQELSYISQWKLPIRIIVINNQKSGMIADQEIRRFDNKFHVSANDGYKPVDIQKIATAYGIDYLSNWQVSIKDDYKPLIYEIKEKEEDKLIPCLPKGNPCQKMEPALSDELFNYLESL